MPVDEGRIIETLRHGLAQVMGLRPVTDMLYGRAVSLMLDDAQPKRPPRPPATISWSASFSETEPARPFP